MLDQNPLGSAAGFGINGLALDREETAKVMGFAKVQSNPMLLGKRKFGCVVVWLFDVFFV